MKNPKSNYIGEARRIKRNRMFIRIIVVAAMILIVSFAIFFTYILSLKKDIDDEFPSSESAAGTGYNTTETLIPSSSDTSETSDTTATTPPETETTPESTSASTEETGDITSSEEGSTETKDPSDPSDPETSATTTVNLLPDDWSDRPHVLFPEKYPLQSVTHAERDQSYSSLKHAVKKYIEEKTDARIGFYYINLNTFESFGYNETQPFVVGSSIYLPLTMLLYEDVHARTRSMDIAVPFSKSSVSEKIDTKMGEVPEGKQYFLWQLAYLALSDGDGAAMKMILNSLGESGEQALMERLSTMCTGIDYASVQNYVDYKGIQRSGKNRSCAYDLARSAEMLYWQYMSYPDEYQILIDALGNSDRLSGIGRQIPSEAVVLQRHGKNSDLHSQSDVAIILGPEPVVVCVTVEADDPDTAQEIQAALGALVYNFISLCHE